MLPPKGTWPEPLPISEGGFNGVYLESYVLLCSILNTHGKSYLDTVENASQSLNPVLLRALSDYSIPLSSAGDLSTKVLSHIE